MIYLFKNNTDSAGNSYGCHENYLTEPQDDFAHYTRSSSRSSSPARSSRGAARCSRRPAAPFCICQRAEHIWEGVSLGHHPQPPDHQHPRRAPRRCRAFPPAHVIVGDSNMSEYATFLKVGTTELLLRMLEDPGTVLRDLTLENPSGPSARSATTSLQAQGRLATAAR